MLMNLKKSYLKSNQYELILQFTKSFNFDKKNFDLELDNKNLDVIFKNELIFKKKLQKDIDTSFIKAKFYKNKKKLKLTLRYL